MPKPSHPADHAVADRERGAVDRRVPKRSKREYRLSTTAQPRGPPDDDGDDDDVPDPEAFSIKLFCRKHCISPAFYFKLKLMGLGPRDMRINRRVLISREAAAAWRTRARDPAAA